MASFDYKVDLDGLFSLKNEDECQIIGQSGNYPMSLCDD